MLHIELFAGCGGLNLGLASVGFKTVLANELSPMAAETFAYNFLEEDLAGSPNTAKRTLWLSSSYPKGDSRRLREDPRDFPHLESGQSDLPQRPEDLLPGSLIVGDIWELNRWLKNNPEMATAIRSGFGQGEIDVVSGGPPCQSFSMAGLREKDSAKNKLPWAFVEFISIVRPKFVLLENVSGILRPFTEENKKYYAWFEVSKAFAEANYIPIPLHINAKFARVAQNRPRFILICIRKDLISKLISKSNLTEKSIFEKSFSFFERNKGGDVSINSLQVLDLNNNSMDKIYFNGTFLEPLYQKHDNFISIKEAIDDLKLENPSKKSDYIKNINKIFSHFFPERPMKNDVKTENNPKIRRRFRMYQVLSHLHKTERNAVLDIISSKTDSLSDLLWPLYKPWSFLKEDGSLSPFETKEEFVEFLLNHRTKKIVQKAVLADQPAPAALSIPDDYCHYDEIRTFSVREMARIQGFPDNFVFRSKVATGGLSRRFEVPQYTQIGNAVPPLLGRALGQVIRSLVQKVE